MRTLCLMAAFVTLLSGCALQTTLLEEHKTDGSYKTSKTTTRTFWDSKSALTQLKTSHSEKTQSIGLEGLDQQSSGTNVITIVEAVVGAAIKAAK